jgi:hypothetical protein
MVEVDVSSCLHAGDSRTWYSMSLRTVSRYVELILIEIEMEEAALRVSSAGRPSLSRIGCSDLK